jgi:DNA polymerase alpha-associated DNA helicase A
MMISKYPAIEIGSVDGFQGREKDVVALSLVRSNDEGSVGFLGDCRRMNVAITRARRCLVVVGDGESVGRGGVFLKRFVGYLEVNGDIRFPCI